MQRAKYRIAVLNTINFSKSMHYNPFAYLRTEKDILKLVNTIIVNTKGEGAQSTEDFWVKAERLYYTALIGYIHYEAPEEEKNFITLPAWENACRIVRRSFALSVSNLVGLVGCPAASLTAFSLSRASCPFFAAQYSRSVIRSLLPFKRSIW